MTTSNGSVVCEALARPLRHVTSTSHYGPTFESPWEQQPDEAGILHLQHPVFRLSVLDSKDTSHYSVYETTHPLYPRGHRPGQPKAFTIEHHQSDDDDDRIRSRLANHREMLGNAYSRLSFAGYAVIHRPNGTLLALGQIRKPDEQWPMFTISRTKFIVDCQIAPNMVEIGADNIWRIPQLSVDRKESKSVPFSVIDHKTLTLIITANQPFLVDPGQPKDR